MAAHAATRADALRGAYHAHRHAVEAELATQAAFLRDREYARFLRRAVSGAYAGLLRDIFGNPYRPRGFEAAQKTPVVLALAQRLYDERDFPALPILADALEDTGCTDAAVLDHCRGPGRHVRGCWVLDLILGKS
jgi:hypothetical protein